MKKGILFLLILFAIYGNTYCEDIAYLVTKDSHLRRGDHEGPIIGNVSAGETVFSQDRISPSYAERYAYSIYVKTEQGREGFIDARNILLKDNQSLPASVTNKVWIPSYYQQFLRGVEKERLFNFEPSWRDEYYEDTKYWYGTEPMWSYAGSTYYNIHNNLIYIKNLYVQNYIAFLTVSQQYNLNTITISVICLEKSDFTPNSLSIMFNEGESYILTLRIDGDYMDVYVNDNKEKIATLVGVDEYFQKSIGNFFMGETVDLSLITWPRRADGSTDYYSPSVANVLEEAKQPEPIDFSVESADTENQLAVQNGAKTNVMPLWAWVAIIGGVVVVAGGAVVFILKRKK